MEDFTKILKQIQQEMSEQKHQFKVIEENITKNINANINEKFQNLEIRNDKLEKKIEDQEKRIDATEKEIRKKNLVFFGLQENEKNYWDLEKTVLTVINEKIDVKCSNQEISSVWRKGKKGEKIRPVIVSFNSLSKKIEILKKKKLLRDSDIYVKEDFPLKIIQKRKELQEELNQLLEQGKIAYLKYDKIIIKEEKDGYMNRNQKRSLSLSPNENNQTKNKTNIQFHKKNKRDISTFFRPKRDAPPPQEKQSMPLNNNQTSNKNHLMETPNK